MSERIYDAIVLGIGGMGSATLLELASRGLSVLGIEQFPLVHDRGSSHGQTRIIRTAYYEHPSYVPLVRKAFELWYRLECLSGKHLLTECSCLSLGTRESELIRGVQQAALEHSLPIEALTGEGIQQRFPAFHCPPGVVGLLEQQAGFLAVEDCVRAQIDEAVRLGARIAVEEKVVDYGVAGTGVSVTTERDRYQAGKLVITAGAWATQLLRNLGIPLRVMRQTLLWYGTSDDRLFQRNRFPIFITETPDGHFYGLPMIDPAGPKVARHYGQPELLSPEEVSREITVEDESPVKRFLAEYLPLVNGPLNRAQTCMYTLSPDRHFIIDVHPEYNQIAVAAGFSGHGFKFATVVGEILADLVAAGGTKHDIEKFQIARFQKDAESSGTA